jgi:hypothetical protein
MISVVIKSGSQTAPVDASSTANEVVAHEFMRDDCTLHSQRTSINCLLIRDFNEEPKYCIVGF